MGNKKKRTSKTLEERIKDRTVLENFIKEKEWSGLIDVNDLIDALKSKDEGTSQTFAEILGKEAKIHNCYRNPGCYKWWAREDDVKDLLCKITDEKIDFDQIKKMKIFEHKNIAKEDFYCIYVGKANNLYDRLKDHAEKTEQSTLRRTICSLVCNDNDSLKEINNEIDRWLKTFKVQYFPLFEPEWTERKKGNYRVYYLNNTKEECSLLDLEYFFINEDFHILNVDANHFADYREKMGKPINAEISYKIKDVIADLSKKKKKWPREKIIEKKNKKT